MTSSASFLLAALCVAATAFFVAAEYALARGRCANIEGLAASGHKRAKLFLKMSASPSPYAASCNLGVILATVALGWLVYPLLPLALGPAREALGVDNHAVSNGLSFAVGYLLVCGVQVGIGVQVAKALSAAKTERVALWSVYPLHAFYLVTLPYLSLIRWSSRVLLALFRASPPAVEETALSEDELRMVVASSHEQGVLDESERKLLVNVLDFNDYTVREVMVPRTRMACLYEDSSHEENLAVIRDTMHTRYPLVKENRDTVIGMVHLKDLYFALAESGGKPPDLAAIKRDILAVPDTMPIDTLLTLFRSKRMHMAVAVDEFGGTSGIVTLEDLLEELVGEIEDEFDIDDEPVVNETEGVWVVDGNLPLRELADLTDERLDDDEADTVGGLIMVRLNRIPRQGERIVDGALCYEIVKMHAYRIGRVRVRRVDT